jgi:hypothetical protein
MKVAVCVRCGKTCSVLQDGTLVEHAQQEMPALLCSGSRTKPIGHDSDRVDPSTRTVPRHREPVFSAT